MPFAGAPDLTRKIELIGVPLDLGAGKRGVRLGPEAIRSQGLQRRIEALGYVAIDAGDVAVDQSGPDESGGPNRPRYVSQIRAANAALANAVERSLAAGAFPIVLGGDHSLAIGALAGVARVKGLEGLIWIDAHADLNTAATSPTGNIHGSSLAAALGDWRDTFDPKVFPAPSLDVTRTVFIGLRDLDPGEKRQIQDRSITAFTMSDIDRLGMPKVMEEALKVAARGPATVHVSFDIDAVDPTAAPGTGTPVPGGLTYREAHLAMEMIAESGVAHSLEMVEVNPLLDDGVMTARIASDLICSALGKSIL